MAVRRLDIILKLNGLSMIEDIYTSNIKLCHRQSVNHSKEEEMRMLHFTMLYDFNSTELKFMKSVPQNKGS